MAKARVGNLLVVGCLLLGSGSVPAWAAPTAEEMLQKIKPRRQDVVCSTPTGQEIAACRVEPIQKDRQICGWILRDPQGRILRRVFDSNGDANLDIWSFYRDGVEVYREIDSNFDKKRDQYRWFNSGGLKWGVDNDQDGRIDTWKMISAEEVSQEILQAILTQDVHRLNALLITDEDMQALGLPAKEISRIQQLRQGFQAKFQNTLAKLSHVSADKSHWLHLETSPPQCLPMDQTGMSRELIKYASGTIMFEANGKTEWLQTGEMIQMGMAWRIIDAPVPGLEGGNGQEESLNPALQKLVDELSQFDKTMRPQDSTGHSPETARYSLQRAEILRRIVEVVKSEQRDPWFRQIADCLSTAAQCNPEDKNAYDQLMRLAKHVAQYAPGSSLAAYVTFREMQADYATKQAQGPKGEFNKAAQEARLMRLAKFVQDYAQGDDTPDALFELGMTNEILGKEIEAKKWYQQLAQNFADNKLLAVKAQGALRRLDLVGNPLKLAGPQLDNPNQIYDIDQLREKVVVIYYWASWNSSQCVGDFAKLKLLLETYGNKGLAVVCVNLDNTPGEASTFLQRAPLPAVHLHQPGGLESKLATDYGVIALPNLFLVGRDGKVVSRTVQVSTLDEELKKLLK